MGRISGTQITPKLCKSYHSAGFSFNTFSTGLATSSPSTKFSPFAVNCQKQHLRVSKQQLTYVCDNLLKIMLNWIAQQSIYNLLGQLCSLQDTVRVAPPTHGLPPLFASCSIVLVLNLVPPPHVFVHSLQVPYGPQRQSTR